MVWHIFVSHVQEWVLKDPRGSVEDLAECALRVCRWNRAKLSKAQRMARVKQRKAAYLKKLENDDD